MKMPLWSVFRGFFPVYDLFCSLIIHYMHTFVKSFLKISFSLKNKCAVAFATAHLSAVCFARIRKHRLWSYCLQFCVVNSRESESDREYTMGYAIPASRRSRTQRRDGAADYASLGRSVHQHNNTLSFSKTRPKAEKHLLGLGGVPARMPVSSYSQSC